MSQDNAFAQGIQRIYQELCRILGPRLDNYTERLRRYNRYVRRQEFIKTRGRKRKRHRR